ncbi:phosphatase PAP2 family protein [Nocardia sp. NPDC050712]|uniref:phosphatase PAP2 family protein n=1 Tax=Nocardia sp. NPDC050712 TaxID=3155518 RepID=UPI0033D335F1
MDILLWLSQHRTWALTTVARWAMNAGMNNAVIAVAALAGLVVVVAKRWWWQGITIVVAVVSAQATARGLKHLIQRERPPADLAVVQVGAFSMPSTVAAMTAAVAVTAYLTLPWPAEYRRWVAGLLAIAIVVIGIAMIYLGAHWTTDVLVGWGVGGGVAGVVVGLVRVGQRRSWTRPMMTPAGPRT